MFSMPIVDLLEEGRKLADTGRRVSVLWQHLDTLVFLARGREYRSEFHINPSDETMQMIKGEMRLHYRTPEGKEEIAVLAEGAIIYTPAGTPHSPRFPPDAFALISERKRRDGEIDRFHWYCQSATSSCTKSASSWKITLSTRSRRHTSAFSTAKNSAPATTAAKSCQLPKNSRRDRVRARGFAGVTSPTLNFEPFDAPGLNVFPKQPLERFELLEPLERYRVIEWVKINGRLPPMDGASLL